MPTQPDRPAPLSMQFQESSTECRPDLLLEHQVDQARRTFAEYLNGLSSRLGAYLATTVEVHFTGAGQRRFVATHG